MDGEKPAVLSNQELTNRLDGLRLHQGDLILLGNLPDYKSSAMAPTWKWLKGRCESNSVAVYIYAAYAPEVAVGLFKLPVYHWTAPFDYPIGLQDASFFREGHFLGVSTNGFEAMLGDIRRRRPREIFILGSMYDIDRNLPPEPTPYLNQRKRLESVLESTKTDQIRLEIDLRF